MAIRQSCFNNFTNHRDACLWQTRGRYRSVITRRNHVFLKRTTINLSCGRRDDQSDLPLDKRILYDFPTTI